MKELFNRYKYLLVIITAFFVLGMLRLNDLSLYTDCTRYLIWGNSIAQGKGFVDDTQPTPEYYIVNAPFYSVILSPVLLIFPLSIYAAKIWTLLWGVLALILFYLWLEKNVNQSFTLAATAFLALNPLTLVISTEVLSESIFLSVIFGSMIFMEQLQNNENKLWKNILVITTLSLLMLIREVGIALVIASVFFLIKKKKWQLALYITLGAVALFSLWTYRNLVLIGAPMESQSPNIEFIFKHFVTAPDTSIIYEMLERFRVNFNTYSNSLGGMIFYRFPMNLIVNPSDIFTASLFILSKIESYIFIFFLPLLAIGVYQDLKTTSTAIFRIAFIFFYLLIILFYPVQDIRFLLPLLPIAIYYVLFALIRMFDYLKSSTKIKEFLAIIIFIMTIAPNLICLFEVIKTNIQYRIDPINYASRQKQGYLRASYFSTPWSVMGAWIGKNIGEGTIIASPDKNIVAFAPKQKFLEINRGVPLPIFEALLRDNEAEYLFAPSVYDSVVEYQTMMDESKRFYFEKIFNLNTMNIYRIHSKLGRIDKLYSFDTTKLNLERTVDLLRVGRAYLLNGNLEKSMQIFNKLQKRFPRLSHIIYQRFINHCFSLDTLNAYRLLQELYLSPTSTSYIAPAQYHIRLMHSLLKAPLYNDATYKAEKLYEISRLCWNLGYNNYAYKFIRQAVNADTTFFVGLLWAWHYGLQVGDTTGIKKYLHALEQIDKDNPIVKSFREITFVQTKLNKEYNPQKRSEIFLLLAKKYDSVDLTEEALDKANLALLEDTNNKDAWLLVAEIFKKRKNPVAYQKAIQKAESIN